MGSLDGKIALITGATSGIGVDIARLFVAEGARVVLCGRRKEQGNAVADELGSAATFVAADVSVEQDVADLVQYAVDRHSKLDVVVNNAAAPAGLGSIGDADISAFRRLFEVNVNGPLSVIKHASRHMRARGRGSIVNIASTSGLVAATSGMDYSVSKAALRHLTRWAAMELGECGVRVNSISPGFIVTGIFGKGAGLSDIDAESQLASLAQEAPAELAKIQPISRPGTGADVAAAALWLAGDASGYVTGHDLVVDGGQTVGQPYSVMQQQRTKLAEILEATPTRRAP